MLSEKGDHIMSNFPLSGIRVIGFDSGIAMPEAGKILGELGADVIKIESREYPDFMRTIYPDPNNSAPFNEANRNKRIFGANLKTEKGVALVKELIKTADIVLENYRGDVMKALGLDYESICQIKPDIIYAGTQAFGKGGPFSDFKGYGPTIAAGAGILSMWAQPDDDCGCAGNFPYPDNVVSKKAALLVIAALDKRRRTGQGEFIDISQVEVAASFAGEAYLEYTINERIGKPVGNRNPYAAPYNCYRCEGDDEWCAVSIFTNEEWERFCLAIGEPDWTKGPKFSDTAGRLQHVDELDKHMEEWTSQYPNYVVMSVLQSAGIAAGIVQRATDQIKDPQLLWRNAFVEVEHPVSGKKLLPNHSFNMSNMTFRESTPAGVLGQHTEEICHELLGMTDEGIRKLIEERVLEESTLT